ncbi:hypothetical protein [Demequina sp.]|uniref:hypothetical protein n=1 Tax=Demequina sp. TaxID=2050685 RepID=UPI0025B7F5E2|nr:hypothetical protein [Demequina sp.]
MQDKTVMARDLPRDATDPHVRAVQIEAAMLAPGGEAFIYTEYFPTMLEVTGSAEAAGEAVVRFASDHPELPRIMFPVRTVLQANGLEHLMVDYLRDRLGRWSAEIASAPRARGPKSRYAIDAGYLAEILIKHQGDPEEITALLRTAAEYEPKDASAQAALAAWTEGRG